MYIEDIIQKSSNFTKESEFNYVSENLALSENLKNLKIFEEPIFAFGEARDDYFLKLKNETVIGDHFMLPNEWLNGANTVISYFLPFTEEIILGNKQNMSWPSNEWLHGRIEGQEFIKEFSVFLKKEISDLGYNCIIPSMDKRFFSALSKESDVFKEPLNFTSNWSERHVAFVCGLGTFGLSKGIITKKGMAGRLGSVVTDLKLHVTKREYDDIYEFCIMCGKCVINCPAKAISKENGKNHMLCSNFLDKVFEKHRPRYGCGKCQVNVPCESKIPICKNI